MLYIGICVVIGNLYKFYFCIFKLIVGRRDLVLNAKTNGAEPVSLGDKSIAAVVHASALAD